jgi:hypothetical protein
MRLSVAPEFCEIGAGNPAAFGSCRGGIFLWASAPSMISPPMSYRLDCRHYVGSGKDSGEQEVAMHQRKTAAKKAPRAASTSSSRERGFGLRGASMRSV